MNMREKMARAMWAKRRDLAVKVLIELHQPPLRIERARERTWETAMPLERENALSEADAALDVLEALPAEALPRFPYMEDVTSVIDDIWKPIIQAIKEGK